MTIKKQSREIYELPDVIYAETIDYGNPRGFKKRVWRPFYEQEAVPHEGIGEYRLVARGTTPVSRTQPPAPVIDSDAGVEHVRFNDGPNERYVDSVTDEELARLKSKSLKNMTDEWDYLLGEISAQKLVLHDGTLDRLNAFIRQRPQPAQDKQEPDAGDAPRISVLKTPEHFPPKVCFSIGVQQFCISPGIGDFTQEDQDNGRLQWYADQLQKAFSNLPHPNPAGEDKNCESAPLLRRFTDNKGNELVEVAAWFYDEMVKCLPDESAPQEVNEGNLMEAVDKLDFFWRWIERAYFDKDLGVKECLGCLVHSPYAPWNFDREKWDTRHKDYDAEIDKVVAESKARPAAPQGRMVDVAELRKLASVWAENDRAYEYVSLFLEHLAAQGHLNAPMPEIEGLNEAIDYFYKQIKPDYGQKSWFDPVIEAARAYQSKVKK